MPSLQCVTLFLPHDLSLSSTKVSTGHPMLDMLIVMLVPILIRNFYPQLMNIVNSIMNSNRTDRTAYERIIEHRKNYEYWWSSDDDGGWNTRR